MSRSCTFASIVVIVLSASLTASGALMAFNGLPSPSDESIPPFSTYTEDEITLFAANGPPTHFHPRNNPINGTRAAGIFASDGFPQRINFRGGMPFTLVALDVAVLSGAQRYRFSSSSGATLDVTAVGTVSFGPNFENVTFVQLDSVSPQNTMLVIDNIRVVPEPAGIMMAVLAAAACYVKCTWSGQRRR